MTVGNKNNHVQIYCVNATVSNGVACQYHSNTFLAMLYRQMLILDRHTGTTCLARMFHWLGTVPVHEQTGFQYIIVSFGDGQCKFLISLPVQNFMPVCLKSGSVPVPKHFGCRYIIFHFVPANKNLLISLPVQNFMPVCLKSGSVPVPKHFGCRYIIFHFVPANKFF